jgi:hypothetical protein
VTTRIASLVFSYNLDRLRSSGRVWSHSAYRGKDYIEEYSAASIATFAHHNPDREYIINCDDVDSLWKKIKEYNVSTRNLNLIDWSERLEEWKNHEYSFFPAMMHTLAHASECMQEGQNFVKLDNDLTCKRSIDDLFLEFDGAILWKKERNVSSGRYYWGERFVCEKTVGTDDFFGYNIGVLGLSKNRLDLAREAFSLGIDMSKVDISGVINFPEEPNFKVKIFACSEQTAYSWTLHKNKTPVRTCEEYFDHHCYVKTKQGCIDSAAYLKRAQ